MRKPMVTRTVKVTDVTIMAVDKKEEKITHLYYTLSRTFKDDKSIIKAIQKQFFIPDNLQLVAVTEKHIGSVRYGMLESEFIKVADKIKDNENNEKEKKQ